MAGAGNRSEKPTPRRLEKARKEGQFPVSREWIAAVQLIVFAILAGQYAESATLRFLEISRRIIASAFEGEWTARRLAALARSSLLPGFGFFALAGAALFASTIAAQLLSTGFGFAPSKLAPDLGRLNPASRLAQLPKERLQQFGRSLLMLPVAAWAVWHVMSGEMPDVLAIARAPLMSAIAKTASSIDVALWFGGGLLLFAAVLDYGWQRYQHAERLKMTKQEIKDEQKESEGNPEIKMRVRRLQRDMARKQMMKEVPKATAVVVNPSHFAVAIKYELSSPGAPTVVAKGKNYLALRIKQKAIDHRVPIVENPPLAQALYKSADVGQEIPPHLYRAVAEVLAYIFKLMNGRLR